MQINNQLGWNSEAMDLTEPNFMIYGALAGIIASVIFLIVHHLTISPIYFVLPLGGFIGALTGMSLAWSYRAIFDEFNALNTVKLFGIYMLPILILEITTYFFLEKSYTLAEATDPGAVGPLLSLAFIIVIPFGLIYGLLQGLVLGGGKDIILSSIAANLVIFVGIGHNLPLFNVVMLPNTGVLFRTKFLIILLIIALYTSFAIALHVMMKLNGSKF